MKSPIRPSVRFDAEGKPSSTGKSERRHVRYIRLSRGIFLLGLIMLSCLGGLRVLSAQGAQESTGATSDVSQLLSDLDDIDTIRPLLPLKLTGDQMDKIIATVSSAQAGYEKKLKAITGPTLAKLADQIHEVKQKSLKGEAIPKDFDAVAKQAENEIIGKRKTLDAETLATVASTIETILTPAQLKMAAKLDKEAQIKLGKATGATQHTELQWFASYIRDAIMTSPRIVTVLKQMRALADSKSEPANGAPGDK